MCDLTMAAIGLSAVVSGAGALYQADAQQKAANFNAQVSEQNAQLARQRAEDAVERGQAEEQKAKKDATLERKMQEASFTAANLDTGYGSPLDVIVATTVAGEMDAATIRANAEREAEDLEMEARNHRNQASMSRFEGAAAKKGGMIGALGAAVDGGVGMLKYRTKMRAT